ncbi:eukaryotic translation initiation factor 4B2 isoform X1 [Cucumis melo]|uniref:Eukaryotic translation initiation factor 4B2 isoform X1 n=1 Tax=Cucumis melo TaxID=3656 RepID=A0A1S3BA92_CUCME|nr:eukaryotic translation initiation factor 4B2 isoform X1 [Cucumis melo]
MSKPWGGIGAWAADAERAEAEEREAQAAAAASQAESKNFPSLREAVSTKPKKKKMSLSEFTMGTPTGPGTGGRITDSQGLTPEEMIRLPTGPKDRSGEEVRSGRLGGGFPTYDRQSMSAGRFRDRDEGDGSWGGGRRSYGGFDEERRGPSPRASNFDQPSRADEVDNWAMTKKSPTLDSGRQNRYGSLGGGMGGMASRADEVDNWASVKKPIPSRSSTFGSGYREANEPDRWGRGRSRDSDTERPRLVLDPPKGNVVTNEATRTNKPNPFGAARPREEVLAEKGLDWKKLDTEIEAKRTSRPTSAHSSRPSSAQSSRSEGPGLQGVENMAKPRPKVNPFGDAKPREVLLEERGKDWRKIDLQLEHRAVDRPETEEEKMLKEEIDVLRKELEEGLSLNANKESVQESAGEMQNLRERINKKEHELETLILDLDDKVRFGKKATDRPGSGAGRAAVFPERPGSGAGRAAVFSERPGSGAGRATVFPERPPSQGSFDESRSFESVDRPRSRGTADVWSRPADDRKPIQGARDGGFLGNRDMERSRDRW